MPLKAKSIFAEPSVVIICLQKISADTWYFVVKCLVSTPVTDSMSCLPGLGDRSDNQDIQGVPRNCFRFIYVNFLVKVSRIDHKILKNLVFQF